MDTHNTDSLHVKTTEKVFRIIETLQEMDGATITELSNEMGIAKSTIHNHLKTLEAIECVKRQGNTYYVGLRFLDHGIYARNRNPLYRNSLLPVKKMADRTGEIGALIVEEHGLAVQLIVEKGEDAVQTYGRVGKRTHLHHVAGGKAILAHLPEDRVLEIAERHGLPGRTDMTVSNIEELLEKIETIRERGFAVSDEEIISGHRAVAAPILQRGRAAGAISIAGPAHRIKGDRFETELPDIVLGAANEIELRLNSAPDV